MTYSVPCANLASRVAEVYFQAFEPYASEGQRRQAYKSFYAEEMEGTWEDLVDYVSTVQEAEPGTEKDWLPGYSLYKRKPDDQLVETKPGWRPPRRVEENVEYVVSLVTDHDGITDPERDALLERASCLDFVMHSTWNHRGEKYDGKGAYRLVLRLSRPVLPREWRRLYKQVATELGAPYDKSTCDPVRFFFAPFYPAGGPEPFVHVNRGVPLDVDMFLAEAPSDPRAGGPQAGGSTLTHAHFRGILPTQGRLEKLEPGRVRDGYEGLRKALDGRPFAEPGERDNTLLGMSWVLATSFPKYESDQIVAPLAHLLDVDEPEPGWPAESLRSKLERDLPMARAEQLETAQANTAAAGGIDYTEEHIAKAVKALGLPNAEALTRQLLVVVKGHVYCFHDDDYRHLGTKDHAEDAVPNLLLGMAGALPVSIGESSAKGWLPKKFSQLVNEYGTVVTAVNKDLRIEHSSIDLRRSVFNHAVCRRDRDLQPKFSVGYDHLIRSWNEPAFLDWLATVAKLDKATCGVVLVGSPGSGKSITAAGVARLWNSRYTPLRDVNSSFNDSISRCPLVYAEETVPWDFRRDTGLLKDLITSDNQQLRAKYQDNAALAGALRVLIAKNDHALFEAGEILTPNTVRALEQRLLLVDTGTKPAPYFTPEEIAQHILWLEQHHKTQPSERGGLWVTGRPSKLHWRMRAYTSRASVSVCQWLLNWLENPALCADTGGKLHRLNSVGMWVNPQLVYSKWATYCSAEGKQPKQSEVAAALLGLGTQEGTLVRIDLNTLAEYAASVVHPGGWYTADALLARVEKAAFEVQKRAN